tara:strand:+ start:586 stop:1197 length:612 start_codon:yes stop_codon:yes gene_type:complete
MEKRHNIDDFLGVFDGYLDHKVCDDLIQIFESEHYQRQKYNRIKGEGTRPSFKKDEAIGLCRDTHTEASLKVSEKLHDALRETLHIYMNETSILDFVGIPREDLTFCGFKIQKTQPSGGYHVWHVEQGYKGNQNRVFVYTVYLNEINLGGETEFLIQKRRISAVKGRICFFPAHFPYVHRGNPPLKDNKYIATSWIINNQPPS